MPERVARELAALLDEPEALELKWDAIDLSVGTVSIRQAAVEVNGFVEIRETKTEGSERLLDLGDLALAALQRHQAAARDGSSFVFVTKTGGHPRRSNLRQREFAPICKKAGIDG